MPRFQVTWIKSDTGYPRDQKRTLKALGFRRLNQTLEHTDTPSIRGMLHKIRHLVRVSDSQSEE